VQHVGMCACEAWWCVGDGGAAKFVFHVVAAFVPFGVRASAWNARGRQGAPTASG